MSHNFYFNCFICNC